MDCEYLATGHYARIIFDADRNRWLLARGEKVGVLRVRLYRPFSVRHFLQDQSLKASSIAAAQPELLLDQLPVGKFKEAAWSVSQLQHEQLWQRVKEVMQAEQPVLTAVTQRQLKIDAQTLMQISLPEAPVPQWVSMTPSSARGKRRAQIWLEYLLWLAALPADAPLLNYERIEVCNDVTIRCSGIGPEDARVHLARWMQACSISKRPIGLLLMIPTGSTALRCCNWLPSPSSACCWPWACLLSLSACWCRSWVVSPKTPRGLRWVLVRGI